MEQIINLLEAANIAYVASRNEIRIKLPGWHHNIVINCQEQYWDVGVEQGSGEQYQFSLVNSFKPSIDLSDIMTEIKKLINEGK